MKLPLDGSPSARSMTVCDHRSTSAISPLSSLGVDRREGQPHRQGRIADRLEQGHLFGCQPRRLAHRGPETCDPSPARPCRWPATPCPRRRRTTPAAPRSGRRRLFAWTRQAVAAQHGARGDAHRGPVGVVGGQRVGDLAGPLPTEPRRGDVAVGRPRCGAHVPAVRGVQITGGLQMFGDQRRVLVGRCRVALLRSRRPGAGAARRDRISAVIRRPPRGSAGGGRRTRRSG